MNCAALFLVACSACSSQTKMQVQSSSWVVSRISYTVQDDYELRRPHPEQSSWTRVAGRVFSQNGTASDDRAVIVQVTFAASSSEVDAVAAWRARLKPYVPTSHLPDVPPRSYRLFDSERVLLRADGKDFTAEIVPTAAERVLLRVEGSDVAIIGDVSLPQRAPFPLVGSFNLRGASQLVGLAETGRNVDVALVFKSQAFSTHGRFDN